MGRVRSIGDALDLGTTPNPLNQPIVGGCATSGTQGYVLAGADSGVFAFGNAPFSGSCANSTLIFPVVGIALTPSSRGYWLVDSNGGVFPFGDATVSVPATQGGQSNPRMSSGNKAKVIFDGGPVFRDITAAIQGAQKSVNIMQLIFDAAFMSDVDLNTRLVDALASASNRGVSVRILLDKHVLSIASSTNALLDEFKQKGATAIKVRDFALWEPDRLHSKVVIIDGATAYMEAQPFSS